MCSLERMSSQIDGGSSPGAPGSEPGGSGSGEVDPAAEGARVARVLVLVRERLDGARVAFPAAAPRFASLGGEADVLAEQDLFLREYLARERPETIARLSLPEATRLVEVGVPVPRDDLPRKLQSDAAVTFVCVVVPVQGERAAGAASRGQDAWVMVPAVGHTFYVKREEPLEDAIRYEVRRLLASQDLGAWDHLGLLPGRAHRLEARWIPLPELAGGGRAAPRRTEISARARRKKAVEALSRAATPLHVVGPCEGPPPVFRDAERARLAALLDGQERLSVLLVGPELAGKSALVQAYIGAARRLVYATSGAQLVAGMSGLGQWQERIRDVMEAACELDAILYFENLEDLLAERVEGGGLDLAGAMRPWIEEGKVRLVAEIREDRLDALEGPYWAFFAALGRIKVEPLTAAQTLEALERRAAHDARAEPHRPAVAASALPALVDMAERYLPYGAFPGKAVRLYEDLRAVREKEMTDRGVPVTIGRADIYEGFSIRTGVPAFLLRDDMPLRVEEIAARLRKQIIGQEEAVLALAQTIGVVKAGLQPSGKPLATFLFVGPTGVGKTELARALAELLFGSADRMARFDMSEFMTPDAADRLIRGTDREGGLLTTRVREEPFCVLLLDEIEKAHRAVFDLLLQVTGEGRLSDARGKTAYFHNTILIMTSNLGSAERHRHAGFGGGVSTDAAHYRRIVDGAFRQELVNRIDRIVPFRALSREEVVGVARLAIDRVARRRGLVEAGIALEVSPRGVERLAMDGYSEAYGARALRRHVEEHLAAPLSRLLARLGGEAAELTVRVTEAGEAAATAGARPEAAGSAAREGAGGARPEGAAGAEGEGAGGAAARPAIKEGAVVAAAETLSLRFEARLRRAAKASRQAYGFDEISRLRREVDAWMKLSPVEQLAEQIDFLRTQLSLGPGEREEGRQAQGTAELLAEHHRLSEVWQRLARAQEDVRSVEELAMMALFEGEAIGPFADEARAAWAAYRRALPYALVAMEPRRNAITMVIEELDEDALDLWLAPMLRELPRRGWVLTLHLDGDKAAPAGGAHAEPWPEARRWGPPRTADEVLAALAGPKRSFRNVLVRVKGAYAGVILALEAGLHRIVLPKRGGDDAGHDGRAHVFARLVALEGDITGEQWEHRSLSPPHPSTATTRRRGGPAAREHDRIEGAVLIAGRRARLDVDPGEYWERLEEIALAHLLLFEAEGSGLSRDDAFLPPGDIG